MVHFKKRAVKKSDSRVLGQSPVTAPYVQADCSRGGDTTRIRTVPIPVVSTNAWFQPLST